MINKEKKAREWVDSLTKNPTLKDVQLFSAGDLDLEIITRCIIDPSFIAKCEKNKDKNQFTALNMFEAADEYVGSRWLYVFSPKNLWLADLLFIKYSNLEQSKEIIQESLENLSEKEYISELLKYNVFYDKIKFSLYSQIKSNNIAEFLKEINEHLSEMKNVDTVELKKEKMSHFELSQFVQLRPKSSFNDYLKILTELLDKYSLIKNKDEIEAAQDLFFKIIPSTISISGYYNLIPDKGEISYVLDQHPWDHLESYIKNYAEEKKEKRWKQIKLVGKTLFFVANMGSIGEILKDVSELSSNSDSYLNGIGLINDGLELTEEIQILINDENLIDLEFRFQNSGESYFKDFFISEIRQTVEDALKTKLKFKIQLNQKTLEDVYTQFFRQKIEPLAKLKFNEVAAEQIKDVLDRDAFLLNIANLSIVEGISDREGTELTFS